MGDKLTFGDIEINRIGLGTNRLTNTPENVDFLRAAVAAGIQMIDTAHLYTGGQSEETIGAALSQPEHCIIATKGGFRGGGPQQLRAEIEESFRRLRTERIDLYYLHRVDPNTPIEESLAVISEFRDAGKIARVGISAVDIHQVEAARKVVPIAAVQNHYNLSERTHDPVVDYCGREQIVFVPYFPLRGEAGGAVTEVARRHQASVAQITLAWLLRRSPTMLPIPGTLSIAHLEENLAALRIELTDAEFKSLTD